VFQLWQKNVDHLEDSHITSWWSLSISQLPNLFAGTPRICNCILLLIVWVRSFIKMLPSVTFVEDKVLIFLILREKNAKIVQLSVKP